MDLYTLDENFGKSNVFDQFNSLVWTERYGTSGDVTVVFPDRSDLKSIIFEGAFLWTPDSKEVMLIDTISSKDNQVTATGNTLDAFLAQRMLRYDWREGDSWQLAGSPGLIMERIVNDMCGPGCILGPIVQNGVFEQIPNLSIVSGTREADSITVSVPYGDVFTALKALADTAQIGFSLYPPAVDGSGQLIFTTYAGLDRTSAQSDNRIILFDPSLDNLTDIETLRSISGYKTVARAWPANISGYDQVGLASVPGTEGYTGFSRRAIMVDASDVDANLYTQSTENDDGTTTPPQPIEDLYAIMRQRARDALANNNYVRTTDGQIVPQNARYIYGQDYSLGDIIELRGLDNVPQYARITEYIRSQDDSGFSQYPTLSILDGEESD